MSLVFEHCTFVARQADCPRALDRYHPPIFIILQVQCFTQKSGLIVGVTWDLYVRSTIVNSYTTTSAISPGTGKRSESFQSCANSTRYRLAHMVFVYSDHRAASLTSLLEVGFVLLLSTSPPFQAIDLQIAFLKHPLHSLGLAQGDRQTNVL